MGRWRDAVVLSRRLNEPIKSELLEELVIDQRSNLVGKDSSGIYLACEYELNRPQLITFNLQEYHVEGLAYVETRGCWVEKESGKEVWNLCNRTKEMYNLFRQAVARSFSCFPFGLDFYGFLQGETDYFSSLLPAMHIVAVTPIHVIKKDYGYDPVGVHFPAWNE